MEYRMSKEYSVRKISRKITCKVDRTIYGNNTSEDKQNGTATRKFLNNICSYRGIDHTKLNTKTDCAKEICKSLNINYKEEYIGTQEQVSAKFLKDINSKLI